MARVFLKPTDQVLLYIALTSCARTVDAEDIWGGVYRLLGRITHADITSRYAGFLEDAGVDLSAFPDGAFWIVNEDCNGFVSATSYPDESSYQAALDDHEKRWEASRRPA